MIVLLILDIVSVLEDNYCFLVGSHRHASSVDVGLLDLASEGLVSVLLKLYVSVIFLVYQAHLYDISHVEIPGLSKGQVPEFDCQRGDC